MARPSYTDPWFKKAKWLTQALIISGTLNAGLLSTFIYSAVKDSHSLILGRSYADKEVDISKAKQLQDLLASYSTFSFQDLLPKLASTDHIGAGYTRRDVALACLIRFHHFNLDRALGGGGLQKRKISFAHKEGREIFTVDTFPSLADYQYQAIIKYAKTEKWPLTARGLFLKIQSTRPPYDSSLLEAFCLTKEFDFIRLLFSKTGVGLKKEHLVALLSQSSWSILEETAEHLQSHNNFNASQRRQFLLALLFQGSKIAAKILLEVDQEYCLKDLDNKTVIHLCDLLGDRVNASFLKSLLESPRPDDVWKKAATLLYEQAAEDVPATLDLATSKRRFIELKVDRAPPSPAVKKSSSYTVISGDSLWKIARKHNTNVTRLRQSNNLGSDTLKVGQTLTIPTD